jgi:hypothetical protein
MRINKLLPVFVLLTACEPSPIYLRVTRAGTSLIAQAYKTWWFGLRSSETPCVHDLTLTRDADGRVVWRTIVDTDRQCSGLKTFVVGRAPDGFRDEVPLTAQLSAGSYQLAAYGIGQGTRQFRLPLNP